MQPKPKTQEEWLEGTWGPYGKQIKALSVNELRAVGYHQYLDAEDAKDRVRSLHNLHNDIQTNYKRRMDQAQRRSLVASLILTGFLIFSTISCFM